MHINKPTICRRLLAISHKMSWSKLQGQGQKNGVHTESVIFNNLQTCWKRCYYAFFGAIWDGPLSRVTLTGTWNQPDTYIYILSSIIYFKYLLKPVCFEQNMFYKTTFIIKKSFKRLLKVYCSISLFLKIFTMILNKDFLSNTIIDSIYV